MKQIKTNTKAFANLTQMVIIVVLVFAILFIGAFVNGEISDSLTDTYASNEAGGSFDETYWHNGTTSGTRTVTFPSECYAGELTGSIVAFSVQNTNASFSINYNLTTNGYTTYTTQGVTASSWHNTTLTTLITNGNVSSGNTSVVFTWETNSSDNNIRIRFSGSYHRQSDYRNTYQNNSFNTLRNNSGNWDSGVDIVQVVVIITILASAIGAIFMFTKFR